jgi:hypothetical protein
MLTDERRWFVHHVLQMLVREWGSPTAAAHHLPAGMATPE